MPHPLFDSLPAGQREALLARLCPRQFARGALVLNQGDPPAGLWFIESGLLQFRIETAAGASSFIGIAQAGDYLGDCELLTGSPHFATVTALADSRLALLPAEAFWQAMRACAPFAIAVAQRIAHSLKLMQQVQDARHRMSLEQQLAGIVCYLAQHFGQAGSAALELTREQLADMAGASRQAIHKHLQRWQQAGWIDYRYGQLRVCQPAALLALLADAGQT